jgi:hypothetical protein
VTAGCNPSYTVVAGTYPGGHPGAGGPTGPGFPYLPTNACTAVTDGALINCTRLALTAYELVDGIPNGKNILTSSSLIYYTYRNNVTVSYADPVGPI